MPRWIPGSRKRAPRNDGRWVAVRYPHFTLCRASTSRTASTSFSSGTANWAAACFCR